MNLSLQVAIVAAKNHISALSDDDFKELANEMYAFLDKEIGRRGVILGE